VAAIIIIVNIAAKKAMAFALDSDVEHETWKWSRYGLKPHQHLEKEVPAGIILAVILSILSLGAVKFMSFLTYETRALKHRAAKRFGYYSYTEMTDWHNGLIGAAGIVAVLILSVVLYFIGGSNDYLWRFAAYYAFWNMIPISKLDGTQIFFGSKILYAAIGIITLIFTGYALLLP
jgi:Zn-dependent protease